MLDSRIRIHSDKSSSIFLSSISLVLTIIVLEVALVTVIVALRVKLVFVAIDVLVLLLVIFIFFVISIKFKIFPPFLSLFLRPGKQVLKHARISGKIWFRKIKLIAIFLRWVLVMQSEGISVPGAVIDDSFSVTIDMGSVLLKWVVEGNWGNGIV